MVRLADTDRPAWWVKFEEAERSSAWCPYIRLYTMSKTIRVPDWFHEHVVAYKREDETMADALVRMYGGPPPEAVAGFLSAETADEMRDAIDAKSGNAAEKRRKLAETLNDS
jgi:hypothetical protein